LRRSTTPLPLARLYHYEKGTEPNNGNVPLVIKGDNIMNQLSPSIRLLTYQESIESGLQIKTLILEHNGNNYHLHGGTRDTIHVFTESIGIYVVTVNKGLGYMGLNSYMTPEPDPINSMYLHTPQEIINVLGAKWKLLSAKTITMKLINYLY
jgi:hypothetical protein